MNYLNGISNGVSITYRENGQYEVIGTMKNGGLQGVWEFYHENGKLKSTGAYIGSKPNGEWKYYNNSGALEKVVEYVDGKALNDIWNDWRKLNSLAWDLYETETNNDKLLSGIKCAKRSIALDKNYYNTDTYASLLYKIGKYPSALEYANKAIELAKSNNQSYTGTESLIKSIKAKL